MTKRTLKTVFLTATLISVGILAGTVSAKGRGGPDGERPHGPPGGHFIERHDGNGDGQVTIDEVTETAETFFAEVDQNSDGAVTPEEAKQHAKQRNERRGEQKKAHMQKRFERRDANSDGKLSQDEVGRMPEKVFGEIDANDDGYLTPEELKAHAQSRRAEHGQRHFEKVDVTGDGKLTVDEVIDAAQRRFEKLDANNDEVVTAEEAKKAGPRHHRGPRGNGEGRRGAN